LRNLLLENDTMEDDSECDEFGEGGAVIDESEFAITEGEEFKEKMERQIVNFEGDAVRRDEEFLKETREKENGMRTPSYAPSRSEQPQSIAGSKKTILSKKDQSEKKAMREFVRKVTMGGNDDLHPTIGGPLNGSTRGVETIKHSKTAG
jgi:hypothetical protein